VTAKQEQSVKGKFEHVIYSPKGSIEGVLLEVEREPTQIVFDRHDGDSARDFEALKKGERVVIRAARQGASPKGESDHAVWHYVRLESVGGRKPSKRKTNKSSGITGVVSRFNYARHGERNGVVLDTGDFVHTKPEGLQGLNLKVGDKVRAEGETRSLAADRGCVVEAVRVNGKRIKKS